MIGSSLKVLWENTKTLNSELYWTGLSDTYARVYSKSQDVLQNTITNINIDRVESDYLIGIIYLLVPKCIGLNKVDPFLVSIYPDFGSTP